MKQERGSHDNNHDVSDFGDLSWARKLTINPHKDRRSAPLLHHQLPRRQPESTFWLPRFNNINYLATKLSERLSAMFFCGQGVETSSSSQALGAPSVPHSFRYTHIGAQVPTSNFKPKRTSPLLKLPAELRNIIYELVAKDQEVVKISIKGHIILPPLGRVCRATRAEMRVIFEEEVISNVTLDIKACVLNFNFDPLFNWLDSNDSRVCDNKNPTPRVLKLHVTCRPELPEGLSTRLRDESWDLSTSSDTNYLAQLLYTSLVTTLTGWSE